MYLYTVFGRYRHVLCKSCNRRLVGRSSRKENIAISLSWYSVGIQPAARTRPLSEDSPGSIGLHESFYLDTSRGLSQSCRNAGVKEKRKLLLIYLRVDALCTGEDRSHITWCHRQFTSETSLGGTGIQIVSTSSSVMRERCLKCREQCVGNIGEVPFDV